MVEALSSTKEPRATATSPIAKICRGSFAFEQGDIVGMDTQHRAFRGVAQHVGGGIDPACEHVGRDADLADQPRDEKQNGLAQPPRDGLAVDSVVGLKRARQRLEQGTIAFTVRAALGQRRLDPLGIARRMRGSDRIHERCRRRGGIERIPAFGRVRIGVGGGEMPGAASGSSLR